MGDPIAVSELSLRDKTEIVYLRATSEIFYHILEKNYTYYGNNLHTQLP